MHIWWCVCVLVLQGCACTPSETASSMPVTQVCILASCNLADSSRGAAQDEVGGSVDAKFEETIEQKSSAQNEVGL